MIVHDYCAIQFPKKRVLEVRDGKFIDFNLRNWVVDNTASDESLEGGLSLRVLASASGILINGRVYPGPEWAKGVKEFAGRPVLKHHDIHADAIGRVSSARIEKLVKGPDFKNDRFSPAIQGKGQPSGLVWATATVQDPDAIIKINDGRLLHVSQGSRIERASCSICGTDRAREHCEHSVGEIYEVEDENGKTSKRMCYIIVDGLHPRELSFVNEPAYGEAMVMEESDMAAVGPEAVEDFQHFWHSFSENQKPFTMVADNLQLVDRHGHTTDLILLDEEVIDINTNTLGNPNKETTDNGRETGAPASGSSLDTEENVMSESRIKELEDKLKEAEKASETVKSEKEDLIKDKEDLRKKLEASEEEVEALKASYDHVERQLADAMEREHATLKDQYFEIRADLEGEAKDKKAGELDGMDVLNMRKLVDELSEAASLKPNDNEGNEEPEGDVDGTVESGAEGNTVSDNLEAGKADNTDSGKEDDKPRKKTRYRKPL